MRLLPILASILLTGTMTTALAHEGHEVVPKAERERAKALQAEGPQENRGVKSVTALGDIGLDGEFESPDDRVLRARELVIEPGGRVAVHQHQGRPGLAYILEGEIVEHRNDEPEPVVRGAGAVSADHPLWLATTAGVSAVRPGAIPCEPDSTRSHRLFKPAQEQEVLQLVATHGPREREALGGLPDR
jgi:quercetin dioxygenase-like cupin family protein